MRRLSATIIIILLLSTLAGCAAPELPTLVPTISLPQDSAQPPARTERPFASPTPADPNAPIWVTSPGDRSVLRVDPLTNSVGAEIRVDGNPDAAVAADGMVWALDKRQGVVWRINAQTDRVTGSVSLPAGSASSIAAGNGAVWVGMTGRIDLSKQAPGQEGDLLPPGFVVRIDPRAMEVAGTFPAQPVSRLRLDGPALWVLSNSVIDTPIQLFDLESGEGMVVPFKNGPEWLPIDALAADGGNLWLYSAAYGKIFHAAPNGLIRSAVSLEERQPVGLPDLLLNESGLWALTTWGAVLHIDPNTNHVLGTVDFDAPMTQLIASPGAVWAHSQQTGMLYRMDPVTHSIAAQIETGTALRPTVIPSPTPRIVLWSPCPNAPTSRLKVGDIAYVTKDPPLPNRVRKEPDTETEILGLIGPGGGMDIIDGPVCGTNNWVWWKVKNADLEGWTPEGDFETYWLIPLYQ